MKKAVSKTYVAIGFLMAHFWSAALANEGSLVIPKQVDSTIKLILQTADTGIDPSDVLQVFVGDREECCDGKSPIAGRYAIAGQTITFDPAFDFVEGQKYTIRSSELTPEDKAVRTLTEFSIEPIDAVIIPEVLAIYPSGDEIPENTLRFYIHFSSPMEPHRSSDFIKLIDDSGTQDTAAFMSFKQELWSEDRKRLTLLMDPGRIKRGVAQNLELGPALRRGKSYSIVIEGGWRSASGKRDLVRFEHPFSVTPALRTLPNTDLWKIKPPRAMTRDPLTIEFDRPFDRALAHSAVEIFSGEGHLIQGTVSIANHENTWRFAPLDLWANGALQLVVDARMEDVAGNNFRELLDHSLDTPLNDVTQKTIFVTPLPAP